MSRLKEKVPHLVKDYDIAFWEAKMEWELLKYEFIYNIFKEPEPKPIRL